MLTPSVLISRLCLALHLSPNLPIGVRRCFGGTWMPGGVVEQEMSQLALKHTKEMFP